MWTTLIFTFLFLSFEKMIAGEIFLIAFLFLRCSLALSSLNLPLKSSSTIKAADFHNPKLPNNFKACQLVASQPPASRQPASIQTTASQPSASQPAASQPPASRHPAVNQNNSSYLYRCMTYYICIRII